MFSCISQNSKCLEHLLDLRARPLTSWTPSWNFTPPTWRRPRFQNLLDVTRTDPISVARDTSLMWYPLLSRFTISDQLSSGKGFVDSKNLPTDHGPLFLVGLNSTGNSNIRLGVLKFPLDFLRKTQTSLRIFESSLARHARCYYPIFEPSMLIFEVWGTRAVRYDRKLRLKTQTDTHARPDTIFIVSKQLVHF